MTLPVVDIRPMGQVDITLRHVTRQHPDDLARAILPPGLSFEVIGWFDSQITTLERRLDKALELRVAGERRVLHVELELDMDDDDPYRVFEYNRLLVAALHAETLKVIPRPKPKAPADNETSRTKPKPSPVPVLSVVILLRGRKEPWPAEGEYSTNWPELAWSGLRFHVEAVYQRTVAELRARGSLLWLVFTPLATDASAPAMGEVLAEIRERVPSPEERADLYTAVLVMAEVDPWGYHLLEEIRAMMAAGDRELLKLSSTLRGAYDEGQQDLLGEAFAERVGHQPTPDERAALVQRARELGAKEALRALLKLHGDALARWLLGDDTVSSETERG